MFVVGISVLSALASLGLVAWSDRLDLRQGVPTVGTVVVGMYVSTYGLGWLLWRSDPSSLFGYASHSTLHALDRMGLLFSVGLPSLAIGYVFVRHLPSQGAWIASLRPKKSLVIQARELLPVLERLCLLLVALGVFAMIVMSREGVFIRDPELQHQAMQSSWLAKILVGSSLLSRLAPVGLLLVPLCWPAWRTPRRLFVLFALSTWFVLAFNSGSRGQLFSIPLYVLIGSILWGLISWRRALVALLLCILLALPVAEWMRVNRAGIPQNSSLSRIFEPFQAGRQLIGTSHELYLMLRPQDCALDLKMSIKKEPQVQALLQLSPDTLQPALRYHVARLYEACKNRSLDLRKMVGFDRLPLGLLPSTFFSFAPSLFDGQELVEEISSELALRPGEISHGTISLFADGWWRYRWFGVLIFSGLFGAMLGLIQMLLLMAQTPCPLVYFFGQLLALSLISGWINNTILTQVWLLAWDLPKSLFELLLLAWLIKPRYTTYKQS